MYVDVVIVFYIHFVYTYHIFSLAFGTICFKAFYSFKTTR